MFKNKKKLINSILPILLLLLLVGMFFILMESDTNISPLPKEKPINYTHYIDSIINKKIVMLKDSLHDNQNVEITINNIITDGKKRNK